MPGQKKKQALLKTIREMGGWDVIFERIASGETLTAIAKEFGCSKGWFSRITNQDPERHQGLQAALRESADAIADSALSIADSVPADRDSVAKARLQVDTRKWIAATRNPLFGEKPGIEINQIDAGRLFIEALTWRPPTNPKPLADSLPTAAPEPLQLPKPWPDSEEGIP